MSVRFPLSPPHSNPHRAIRIPTANRARIRAAQSEPRKPSRTRERAVSPIAPRPNPNRAARVSVRFALTPPPRSRQILKHKQPALPRHHKIQIAISIQIGHRNLHPPPSPCAVINHVLHPFDFLPPPAAETHTNKSPAVPAPPDRVRYAPCTASQSINPSGRRRSSRSS